tara:strand:- start:17794 stop:18819 length:1026 start_codon:yes stop_codon:yes gene_type:complete
MTISKKIVLAGDLGGTKTLLGIYENNNGLKLIHRRKYMSNEWESLNDILRNFYETFPNGLIHPQNACIAVAGPVLNGLAKITNLGWNIKKESIKILLNLKKLDIINDFSALIYCIPNLRNYQYSPIQNFNSIRHKGIFTVLGAGTGLGLARGFIKSNNVIAFPSEGGHMEFSPRTEKEWRLSNWLKKDLGVSRLSVERVISGKGLSHIGRWFLSQSNMNDHPLSSIADSYHNSNVKIDLSSAISLAAKNGDELMKEALELWLSAYGSFVGDIALNDLCSNGLWIAGGTAKKHLEGIQSQTFLSAMKNKGRFSSYLEKLPLMAITDEEAGLYGAACRACMLS